MVQKLKHVFMCLLLMMFIAGVTGCEQEGTMEKAGKAVDEAVEKTGEAVDEAAEKTGEAVEDVKKDVEESMEEQKDKG